MNAFQFTIVLASPKNYILKENGKEYDKILGDHPANIKVFVLLERGIKKNERDKGYNTIEEKQRHLKEENIASMGVQSTMDGFIFGSKIGKDEE